MFAVKKNNLFGISLVTFEVSSCTKLQIFWSSTPGWEELTGFENASFEF